MNFKTQLTQEIYKAVKSVLTDLLKNKEHYYYITLTTDGEVDTPCVYMGARKTATQRKQQQLPVW